MSELILFIRGAIALPREWMGTRTRAAAQSAAANESGRLYALDLARFIAMVFMMQGHVLDALVATTELAVTEFPWNIWHIIRGFTAPVFLMVSGAVHAFATKREQNGMVRQDVISKRIRWALTIVGLGYFMMFPASTVWDLPYVPSANWTGFLSVNILQLTGATLLLFIVLASGTRSTKQLGLRSFYAMVAILALTPLMQVSAVTGSWPLWLQSYVNTSTGSLFPMFPFSAYLFAGLFVGTRLNELPSDTRDSYLKRNGWRAGIGLVALSALAMYLLRSAGISETYITGSTSIPLFVFRSGVVLTIFSIAVVLVRSLWGMRSWFSLFGSKSLHIYVIHLVILFGTPWVSSIGRTHYRSLSLLEGILVAACVIVLTLTASWALDAIMRWPLMQRWQKTAKIAMVAAILTILVF